MPSAPGPGIFGEFAGIAIAFTVSLVSLALFFQRRRTFPPVLIGLILFALAFAVADHLVVAALAEKFPDAGLDRSPKLMASAFVQALIWIPYLLLSRRVRATFVK